MIDMPLATLLPEFAEAFYWVCRGVFWLSVIPVVAPKRDRKG